MVTGFSASDIADSFAVLEGKDFLISKLVSKNFYKFRIFENLM